MRYVFAVLAAAAAMGAAISPALARQEILVIARTGDAAPDGNGTFASVFRPVLNDAGQLAFVATLDGTAGGTADDLGAYLTAGAADPFGLIQVVRQGQTIPDGNGTIGSLSSPLLNNDGQIAFNSSLNDTAGGSADDDGQFFFEAMTGLAIVARAGEPAPDGNGKFDFFIGQSLNEVGQVAFTGRLTGTSGGSADSEGIFRSTGAGPITQIVRQGQAAPGGIGTFSMLFGSVMNDSGEVAFAAFLSGTSGGLTDDLTVWRADGAAAPVLIAREGQPAPGGDGTFGDVDPGPAINNLGQVALRAEILGASGGTSEDFAIYRADTGGLVEIMRAGQTVPGGDGQFGGTPLHVDLNDAGQIVFQNDLANTSGGPGVDDSGIYRGDGTAGSLIEIARSGALAPGGNGNFLAFDQPIMNEAGQVAFLADLTATSGGTADDAGIYLHDDALGLLVVAREGQALDGGTIASLDLFSGIQDERSGLNNNGQVAFAYTLTNGDRGVAIWTVPEPSSLALAGIAGLTLLRRGGSRSKHLHSPAGL